MTSDRLADLARLLWLGTLCAALEAVRSQLEDTPHGMAFPEKERWWHMFREFSIEVERAYDDLWDTFFDD